VRGGDPARRGNMVVGKAPNEVLHA
jgi:hypothetical protein